MDASTMTDATVDAYFRRLAFELAKGKPWSKYPMVVKYSPAPCPMAHAFKYVRGRARQ